jgi:hypothetical protein
VPEDIGLNLPFSERAVQVSEQFAVWIIPSDPIRPEHPAEALTETSRVFEPQTLNTVFRDDGVHELPIDVAGYN